MALISRNTDIRLIIRGIIISKSGVISRNSDIMGKIVGNAYDIIGEIME